MSINVDARGLSCPQPVIATKNALEKISDGIVLVIVDNAIAKENVSKFAVANHCGVSCEEREGAFYIRITKGAPETTVPGAGTQPVVESTTSAAVYLITQDTLGHGSQELGAILMKSFFYTLTEAKPLPRTLMFINSGVRLTVAGSPVLEYLQLLAKQGVTVLSCGTCLDYYQLKEALVVGGVTNMYTIITELTAGKGITI